jgi:hypothetical protein
MRVYDRSRLKTRNVKAICRHFRSPAAISSKPEVMRNWVLPAPRPKGDIAAIRNKPHAAPIRWACVGGIMISLSAGALSKADIYQVVVTARDFMSARS